MNTSPVYIHVRTQYNAWVCARTCVHGHAHGCPKALGSSLPSRLQSFLSLVNSQTPCNLRPHFWRDDLLELNSQPSTKDSWQVAFLVEWSRGHQGPCLWSPPSHSGMGEGGRGEDHDSLPCEFAYMPLSGRAHRWCWVL